MPAGGAPVPSSLPARPSACPRAPGSAAPCGGRVQPAAAGSERRRQQQGCPNADLTDDHKHHHTTLPGDYGAGFGPRQRCDAGLVATGMHAPRGRDRDAPSATIVHAAPAAARAPSASLTRWRKRHPCPRRPDEESGPGRGSGGGVEARCGMGCCAGWGPAGDHTPCVLLHNHPASDHYRRRHNARDVRRHLPARPGGQGVPGSNPRAGRP